MRWKSPRRDSRGRDRAKETLHGLLHSKLAIGQASMRKETFAEFWRYRSVTEKI